MGGVWSTLKGSSLTELQLRKANKAVLGIAESKEPNKRGKYNQYTLEQLIYDYIAACMHTVNNNFMVGVVNVNVGVVASG